MMKKISVFTIGIGLSILLGGCSQSKEFPLIQEQEKQLEQLTHEKKELEFLLENEKQKASISTTADSRIKESDTEEATREDLASLFDSFIHAQFSRDEEALASLTSAKLYTTLVDKSGEYATSVAFESAVTSITLFQAEVVNETEAVLVGKIEVQTMVGDFEPNRYQQLVECTAKKNSEGLFQVDTQELTTLAK